MRRSRLRNSVAISVAASRFCKSLGELGQFLHLVAVLLVDGLKLLIDALQLFFGGFQLLHGGAQLLVGGLHLFAGSLHLLLAGFILLDDGLQPLARQGELGFQILNPLRLRRRPGVCAAAPASPSAVRFALLENDQGESFPLRLHGGPHMHHHRAGMPVKAHRNRLGIVRRLCFPAPLAGMPATQCAAPRAPASPGWRWARRRDESGTVRRARINAPACSPD